MDSIREKFLSGRVDSQRAVKFRNPTDKAVVFAGNPDPRQHTRGKPQGTTGIPREVGVLVRRVAPTDTNPYGELFGSRFLDVLIPPGETVAVPEDVANELQAYRCLDCQKNWRFGQAELAIGNSCCFDSTHRKMLMSGLAPQLVLVDDEGREMPPEVHPNLVPEPPPVAHDPVDLHERVMRRIGGGK